MGEASGALNQGASVDYNPLGGAGVELAAGLGGTGGEGRVKRVAGRVEALVGIGADGGVDGPAAADYYVGGGSVGRAGATAEELLEEVDRELGLGAAGLYEGLELALAGEEGAQGGDVGVWRGESGGAEEAGANICKLTSSF